MVGVGKGGSISCWFVDDLWSNPDENAEHANGQNEHVQLRQMQTSNLDQNKEHTIDQNQHQSGHRSSTNQLDILSRLNSP
jgi:hypothetical protein